MDDENTFFTSEELADMKLKEAQIQSDTEGELSSYQIPTGVPVSTELAEQFVYKF